MKKFLLTIAIVCGAVYVQGQEDCIPRKDERRLVYDATGTLSKGAADQLDAKLQEFAKTTSNQIVVALVEDMCGYSPEQLATKIGDTWQVGQAKEDNGIVVLVKPNGQKGDRHAFIAIGKGLEGAIPDATAYQIVQKEMLPRFKMGDFYTGLDDASTVLMELARGEYDSKAYSERSGKLPWQAGLIIFAVFVIVIIAGLSRIRSYARTNDIGFWAALAMMSAANRSHGGSWGHFSGGSGGFGGGGGGFGGFGGGSFGGGGAGGSW